MGQSVHTREYKCFLRVLRQTREQAKVTQVQLAEKLGISKSHLSKLERGELRIDIVQIRSMCNILGTSLPDFIQKFEAELPSTNPRKGS